MDHDTHDDDELARLVTAAKAGDPEARAEVLRLHLPGVRAYVRLKSDPVLRQRESTSDLVQSVCREVLQGLDDFEWSDAAGFRGWLYTLTLNRIRGKGRYHRAAQRAPAREEHRELDDELLGVYAGLDTPSAVAMRREEAAALERAFDALSPDHAEVILLSRVLGLPHREVAARMGRSEVAVRSLLGRALVVLSGMLGRG